MNALLQFDSFGWFWLIPAGFCLASAKLDNSGFWSDNSGFWPDNSGSYGGLWRFMAGLWRFMAVYGGLWRFMARFGRFWSLLVVPKAVCQECIKWPVYGPLGLLRIY